jgi:uncharacterized protein (TIGR00251 family)
MGGPNRTAPLRQADTIPRVSRSSRPGTLPFIDRSDRGVLLHVHVVPGAARTEIAGLHDDRLKIRVKAAAAEGAANRELLRFLADLFEVGPSYLEIVRGASDRRKTVRLPAGVDIDATGLQHHSRG